VCGIVGIVGKNPVNQSIYDGLTVLQHRGPPVLSPGAMTGLKVARATGWYAMFFGIGIC